MGVLIKIWTRRSLWKLDVKEHSEQGKSKGKGPDAGINSACSQKRKRANMTGRWWKRGEEVRIRFSRGLRSMARILDFLLDPMKVPGRCLTWSGAKNQWIKCVLDSYPWAFLLSVYFLTKSRSTWIEGLKYAYGISRTEYPKSEVFGENLGWMFTQSLIVLSPLHLAMGNKKTGFFGLSDLEEVFLKC